MRKQVVVVIYSCDDWYLQIPFKRIATRKSFELWHTEGQLHGFDVYRASIQWYDEKKNVFTKSWAYRDGAWKKISVPIRADFIFDKTTSKQDAALYPIKHRMNSATTVFNTPPFRTILNNKLTQYMLFKEFMPLSILVQKHSELADAIKKLRTDRVVAKPLYGVGGEAIHIEKKSAMMRKRLTYPILLQEFINGSGGVPNQPKTGLADLRIVYINHKPLFALSRIAKKNSLFTNLHQGASAKIIALSNIPQSVTSVTKRIIDRLSVFPQSHYSLDFLFKKDGTPVLMEMNTTPGFDLLHIAGSHKLQKKNMLRILSALKS